MILVKERELVVPGQLLAEGEMKAGKGAYRDGKRIYSCVTGLVEVKKGEIGVIALEGAYEPKVGDDVIGLVVDSHPYGWKVDVRAPTEADLWAQDAIGKVNVFRVNLSSFLRVGDMIYAKVLEVTGQRKIRLSIRGKGYGKLKEGWLVEITPVKTPRVIGRRRSMLNTIRQVMGCELKVGQNGRIVIQTNDSRKFMLISQALKKIEREAHTTGLTDRIKALLEEGVKHGGEAVAG